ncbi:MAG TPA: hypothetical protein VGP51_05330 [Nocardioidaceae bacterium]|nr:hypothetical protein [Nocardioidaceae bacterium]
MRVEHHDASATAEYDPAGGPFTDPRVADAVARVGRLGQRPVEEHVLVYDEIHQSLRDVLTTAGEG